MHTNRFMNTGKKTLAFVACFLAMVLTVGGLFTARTYAGDNIPKVNEEYTAEAQTEEGFDVTVISRYLDILESMQSEIDTLAAFVDAFDGKFAEEDSSIAKYVKKASEILDGYSAMKEFIPLIRALIGDGSDRLYVLAAQNSAEIRASGGFPGAIGVIRIRNGILSLEDFTSVYNAFAGYTSADAAVTEQEAEIFGDWMYAPRDAGFCPDFTRVGKIWALAYQDMHGEGVNGVIALTPTIIQRILKICGGITLSDGTALDGTNATKVLQHEIYLKYFDAYSDATAGESVSDSLFAETARLTLQKFTSDFDFSKLNEYCNMVKEGIADRTIMFWFADAKEEQTAIDAGAAGDLSNDPLNPVTGVYFSCSDPSKLGWYLDITPTISKPVKNSNGTYTYNVSVVLDNVLDEDSQYRSGSFITGEYGGGIYGCLHIFGPAKGKIDNIEVSNGTWMASAEYNGLQCAYTHSILVNPGEPITINYTVTTAKKPESQLRCVTTPTLTKYR